MRVAMRLISLPETSLALSATLAIVICPALILIALDGYTLYGWIKGCLLLEGAWRVGSVGFLVSTTLFLLLNLSYNGWRWWRVHRDVSFLPLLGEAKAAFLRQALPGLDRVTLRVCQQDVRHACTVGWRQPSIVLSRWLLGNLDDTEIIAATAHELAHIQHRDNLLMFWAHSLCPAGFGLSLFRRQLLQLTALVERRADNTGAAMARDRLALASALVKVQRASLAPLPVPVSSFGGDTSLLQWRIAALLEERAPAPRVPPSVWVLLSAIGLCGALLLAQAHTHLCSAHYCQAAGMHPSQRP